MFLPQYVIVELKKKYKDSSIKTIDNNIKRIFNNNQYDKNLFNDYEKIHKFMELIGKTSVKKSLINNIVVVCGIEEINNDKYKELFKLYAKEHDNEYKYNSKYICKNVPNLEFFKERSEMLKNSKKQNLYIISCLYTYLPALRGEEFYKTKIGIQLNENYLDIDRWVLVVQDYKTVKKYGVREIKIPLVLQNILKEYCKTRIGKYLISIDDEGNKKIGNTLMVKYLHIIFGDKISVDVIRKIFITEVIHYLEKYPFDEKIKYRKRMAYLMGHDISTQEFIYSNLRIACSNFNYSGDERMNEVVQLIIQI